ncbi:MAG: dynamin family protein [Kiritimatiellia bacterium]|jgi:hypothetical protein
MSKRNAIQNAVSVLNKNAVALPEKLRADIEALDNPEFRVAVVGKYQVGKSTLVNRAFLGDAPLLLEGNGICTTAVATEVAYGLDSKLVVYKWADGEKTKVGIDRTIDNPTKDDIRDVTVANTGESRAALAARLPKVRVLTPNEHLKGYTIVDTPGIDDPDPSLLVNTTYRVIPEADLAIVVAGCSQLDEVEMTLIRRDLVNDGISRLMVLLSYRPESERTEETRKNIMETVKAQLANIGKEDVPVEMFCFDEAVPDILNTVPEIRFVIRDFLVKNALEGRTEKVALRTKRFLGNLLMEISAKISTLGQSDAEKAALSVELDRKEKELRDNFERLFRQIEGDFDTVKMKSLERFEDAIAQVFDELMEEIGARKELGDVQKFVGLLEQKMNRKMTFLLYGVQAQVNNDVQQVVFKYQGDMASVGMGFSEFARERLSIDPGVAGKIPAFACEVVNVAVMNLLLPMGWILAVVGRILHSNVPLLNKLTSQNLVKAVLVKKVKTQLDEARRQMTESIQSQLDENFEKIKGEAKQGLVAQYEEQIAAIRAGMRSEASSEEKQALLALKSELEQAVAAL